MGDRIPTAAKVILLILVLGTFLFIYAKPGAKVEQSPSAASQSANGTAGTTGFADTAGTTGAASSKAGFAVTPNPGQALQTALQTDKPALLEFYGSG